MFKRRYVLNLTYRRIRIRKESLVGEAHEQGGLSDRGVTSVPTSALVHICEVKETTTSDDELEDIVPCGTGHYYAPERRSGKGWE
jgi:hypothetical protein